VLIKLEAARSRRKEEVLGKQDARTTIVVLWLQESRRMDAPESLVFRAVLPPPSWHSLVCMEHPALVLGN
jgi:hypothetical protein